MTRAREAARLIGNNTFRLDSNNAVGFNSTTPDAMFDINHGLTVAGVSTFTGNVTMSGDLTVQGTTTTLDTIVQEVDLMNIQANSSTPGLGVTQSGAGDIAKFYDGTSAVFTIADGGGVTVESGTLTLNNNLDMQDNDIIYLGAGNDLQIYHDGSNSYIKDAGTGNLEFHGGNFNFRNADGSEYFIRCINNNAVQLYWDNSQKLATKTDGIDVTGEVQCDSLDVDGAADITGELNLHNNLSLQDNDKINFGGGNDLQIYHNGSNSYIDDGSGTGALIFKSNTYSFRNAADSEQIASFNENGAVDLYYDNSKKFETKSDGVDITGELQSDSLDVDGVANIQGVITVQAGAVAEIGTLNDGATVTPDLATHCNFTITLGGNRTLANPSNIVAGQSGSIFVVQDGTGGRSFNSFGSYWDFIGGTVPSFTSTAGAVDRIDYIVRSSTKIHAVFTANYS